MEQASLSNVPDGHIGNIIADLVDDCVSD